ncbi:ABC transporter substrate-binding protein [Streptomyces litchfieldiae]|uniref:ABC transporter substrate-binding protein n=1 Tax=Streptomyces litchfieldiae TaxID=3075543 RepID=A0ABU2MIW5_9ACTN|nr:ABC transporter substrate-binding protein [Streptomyces sp. DSM 44938]MDT0341540.1 ABC transporter substrate-binding protein [Streptomyces sp. DSM 44938]
MRARTPGRRVLIPALALALLSPALGGCGRDTGAAEGELTVLGPWTDQERVDFERELVQFEQESGISVDYQGTTATREVLLAGVQSGDPPDIAILPGLGDLAEYAAQGQLQPLEDIVELEDSFGDPWLARPDDGRGDGPDHRYWVPVKVDLKSIVWFEASRGVPEAPTDPSQWCLGMLSDATTGWPGTDWIEDILLQRSGPAAYDAWATGALSWTAEPVLGAWRTFGSFLASDPSGRAAEEALLTDHRGRDDGSGGLLLAPGHGCSLEHQGSFARSFYSGEEAARLDFVPSAEVLPGAEGTGRAREVAGDFAAMFRQSEEAEALMRYLAAGDTQAARAGHEQRPVFSAHNAVGPAAYRGEVSERLAQELRDAETLCLDASDVMPPTIGHVFSEKVIEFLADPGRDPAVLLGDIQRVQDELPEGTAWLEQACN